MGGAGLSPIGGFRHRGARLLIPLLMLGLLMPAGALGQADPRDYISLGSPSEKLFEPCIAVGPDLAVVVYHSVGEGVRYTVYEQGQWVDKGLVRSPISAPPLDPSVTYDARNNTFVAAAVAYSDSPPHCWLLTSRFGLDSGQFEEWVVPREGPSSFGGFDKPWIVAGDPWLDEGQELYIICRNDTAGQYAYFKSHDSGQTWVYDEIYLFGDPGQPLNPADGLAQPTVWNNRPVYLAYPVPPTDTEGADGAETDAGAARPGKFKVIRGTDMDVHVYWEPLYTGPGIPLTVSLFRSNVRDYLPGQLQGMTVPWLAADPSTPFRLYLVYHDVDSASSADVNVYLRVLLYDEDTNEWSVGDRIRVNQDDDEFHRFDQFTPSVAVDANGVLHVLFYDDRDYPEQEDTETHPKFNMYWAYTRNEWQTWTEWRMPGPPEDPNEPALNWDEVLGEFGLDPREYNGLTCFGSQVWSAYTGTWAADPQPNNAVVATNPMHY